ncbi:MAG: prenyltransferase [Acidimicrobiales bacterium]
MSRLELGGVLDASRVALTLDSIAALQLGDGMIPWFPGGHCDPWNHVECAMALTAGGRRAEAERAYEWLVSTQRDDGSWHQYYVEGGVEDAKLDANVIAYVATGTWHHFLSTADGGFLAEMWPVVERAIDFVLDLQTPRGEILWARHADGTPWSFALLTGSSSTHQSLRCAIAAAEHLGHERPDWELSVAALARVIANEPDAFAPKHRWAMDWYYPVLGGVLTGGAGRAHLAQRWSTFAMEGKGIRCVSDRPWITTAETCECALAHDAVGEGKTARDLLAWAQRLRHDDGSYWTGVVEPEGVHFPGGERTSYSAAAVVLAVAALAESGAGGAGPGGGAARAAGLFRGVGLPRRFERFDSEDVAPLTE